MNKKRKSKSKRNVNQSRYRKDKDCQETYLKQCFADCQEGEEESMERCLRGFRQAGCARSWKYKCFLLLKRRTHHLILTSKQMFEFQS